MEHTKGKFEAMPYTRRDGDNIRWVKAVKGKKQAICQTFKPNAEANAKELVRRWNAFEKDGLVDELVDAFKELAATFVGLPEGSIGGQAMKKAEAAIAKVKS